MGNVKSVDSLNSRTGQCIAEQLTMGGQERKAVCDQQQQLVITKLLKLQNTSGSTEKVLTILTTTSVPLVPLENSL